jgi:hypothetical protein
LFIHYSISRGGETNQLLSFFQHWSKAFIASVPTT